MPYIPGISCIFSSCDCGVCWCCIACVPSSETAAPTANCENKNSIRTERAETFIGTLPDFSMSYVFRRGALTPVIWIWIIDGAKEKSDTKDEWARRTRRSICDIGNTALNHSSTDKRTGYKLSRNK